MDILKVLNFNTYIVIINLSLCVYAAYFLNGILKYLNKKNNIMEYTANLNFNITQKEVDDELELFIKGRWEEYFIFNLGWKTTNIIDQKEQKKVIIEMGEIVSSTISPILLSKLSLYYSNIKNSNGVSGIDSIIANKIQIIVLNYTMERNTPR